jgi:hypothetical protein
MRRFDLRSNSEDARARAEASFKRKERQAIEGAKAMAEYEAQLIAVRERTARLRALRLAKQAEDAKRAKSSSPAAPRTASGR